MLNTCLKGCIQSYLTLFTPLTRLQWVNRGRDQRHRREENQSSIHLTGGIRWFVLAVWENPANMHLKVLARHLHQMTYPRHRTGVTTGSSTELGESVQLLSPRNGMNIVAKSKGVRIVVTLECTECRSATAAEKRSPGVSRYTTTKNRRNNPERLELKKFCPQLKRMTFIAK